MREILFRAKEIINGNRFVFGDLVKTRKNEKDIEYSIIEYDKKLDIFINRNIIQDTICQSTGLLDKNNVRIFENDFIKEENNIYRVIFESGCYMAFDEKTTYTEYLSEINRKCDIIGNIYDNTEYIIGF